MASKTVIDAVNARAGAWDNIDECPLAELNELANSPKAYFLQIEYPVANEERITLGVPALFREGGAIRFVINAPHLQSIDTALTWVEELRDLFRDKEFAGIRTYEASPAAFDPSNRNDNGFYQLPFVVTYDFDIEK